MSGVADEKHIKIKLGDREPLEVEGDPATVDTVVAAYMGQAIEKVPSKDVEAPDHPQRKHAETPPGYYTGTGRGHPKALRSSDETVISPVTGKTFHITVSGGLNRRDADAYCGFDPTRDVLRNRVNADDKPPFHKVGPSLRSVIYMTAELDKWMKHSPYFKQVMGGAGADVRAREEKPAPAPSTNRHTASAKKAKFPWNYRIENEPAVERSEGEYDRRNAARYVRTTVEQLRVMATRGKGPKFTKEKEPGSRTAIAVYAKADLDQWLDDIRTGKIVFSPRATGLDETKSLAMSRRPAEPPARAVPLGDRRFRENKGMPVPDEWTASTIEDREPVLRDNGTYSRREAACYLSTSVSMLNELAKNPLGPTITRFPKAGGHEFEATYTKEALDQFLDRVRIKRIKMPKGKRGRGIVELAMSLAPSAGGISEPTPPPSQKNGNGEHKTDKTSPSHIIQRGRPQIVNRRYDVLNAARFLQTTVWSMEQLKRLGQGPTPQYDPGTGADWYDSTELTDFRDKVKDGPAFTMAIDRYARESETEKPDG